MSGMIVKQTDYSNHKGILAIPDHYVAIGRTQAQQSSASGIVTEDNGRYVVKAGTVYPSDDDKAIGLVMNDYDVTDGDVNMAILVHGFVLAEKLPKVPSDAALVSMRQITILKKDKSIAVPAQYPGAGA